MRRHFKIFSVFSSIEDLQYETIISQYKEECVSYHFLCCGRVYSGDGMFREENVKSCIKISDEVINEYEEKEEFFI